MGNQKILSEIKTGLEIRFENSGHNFQALVQHPVPKYR